MDIVSFGKKLRLGDRTMAVLKENNFSVMEDLKLMTTEEMDGLGLPLRDAKAIKKALDLPAKASETQCSDVTASEASREPIAVEAGAWTKVGRKDNSQENDRDMDTSPVLAGKRFPPASRGKSCNINVINHNI